MIAGPITSRSCVRLLVVRVGSPCNSCRHCAGPRCCPLWEHGTACNDHDDDVLSLCSVI